MARRTHGPKRNAEKYAYRAGADGLIAPKLYAALVDAWLAGYRAAARARRISRPKPRLPPRK